MLSFGILVGLVIWVALAARFEIFAWPLYPILIWFKGGLERRYGRSAKSDSASIDGIIVLGGDIARLKQALQIAAQNPAAFFFVSGPKRPEAKYLHDLKDRPRQAIVDESAHNTFENALGVKRLIGPTLRGRWILVTSAMHMRRALATFQAQGLAVEPWPVFDADGHPGHVAHMILHEIIGLVLYRAKGRIGGGADSIMVAARPAATVHDDRVHDRGEQ